MVSRLRLRIALVALVAACGVGLFPCASSARPALVAQSAERDVEHVCAIPGLPNAERTVHVSATAPSSARQGDEFIVEVRFSFETVPGITQRAEGTLLRAAASGGTDLVSVGPTTSSPDGTYETTPAPGTFSVWGDVGQAMDFHAGRVTITTWSPFPGLPPSTVSCDPIAGSPAVVSVQIDPPEDGGPITDELGIRVVAVDGTVLYQRRELLESGDFVATRNPLGAVGRLSGSGTYGAVHSASVSVLSGVPPNSAGLAPATILSVSDPTAGVTLMGLSGVPHKSSGTRESIAGFALGRLDGYPAPVGIYWFVRDLA